MRTEIKKYYYFDEKDRKSVKLYLVSNGITRQDLSKKLGISLSLLASMLCGSRAITENNIKKFTDLGIILDLGE